VLAARTPAEQRDVADGGACQRAGRASARPTCTTAPTGDSTVSTEQVFTPGTHMPDGVVAACGEWLRVAQASVLCPRFRSSA